MNASAQHQLAQQYLEQKNAPAAIAIVEQLLAQDSDDPIAHYLQADIWLAQGNPAAAQTHLEQAVKHNPAYIDAWLKLGNVQFMQQNYAAAIATYQQVTSRQPNHVEAFYYAGLAHRQLGQNNEAIASYQTALNLASDRADIWTALGNIYFATQNYDQAAHSYQQAITADPKYAHAFNGLGGVFGQQGNAAAAAENFRQVINIDPQHLDALTNLGMALFRQEQYSEALGYFQGAEKISPQKAPLQRRIGLIFYKQNQLDAAISQYQKAIAIDANFTDAYISLGIALAADGQPAAAIAAYQKAIEFAPNHVEANYNLGVVLAQQNQLAEAVMVYCRAIAANPNYTEAYNGLGATLLQQGNLDGAINAYQKALALEPEHGGANFGLAACLLTQGNFAAGLPGYEYRFTLPTIPVPEYAQPLWDGSQMRDRTILLWIEQGLGDAIQFIRFVPLVAERVGRVVVKCRDALVPLFAGAPEIATVAEIVSDRDPLPKFDVHASLLSLPKILGITLETIPDQVPYLSVDRQTIQQHSLPTEATPNLKIGMVWASGYFNHNPNAAKQYQLKSLSLLLWISLLTIPGTRFYSLQLGKDAQEISWLNLRERVADLSDRIDDFADTAAFVTQMDLVISVDTAVAHLAAAMAKPTWVLLPFAPDWRWLSDRDDSPWYPTMRLFRQSEPQQWQGTIQQVRDELIKLVKTTKQAQKSPLATQLKKFKPEPVTDQATLASYWQKLAARLSTQNNYEDAQFFYRRVLAMQPDHAEVANNLGYVCWRLQKLADAEVYLDRAVALKPDYAEAFNNKGIVAWTKQDYAAAIANYQQALTIDPDYAMAHSNLGVVFSHQKDFAQAEAHYRRAIAIKPDYTQALNNLGIALYEQDRGDEAIPYYRQALALNPDYYQALSNCGAALVAAGQIDEAIDLYHRAIAINPNYPEVQNNLGMALLELGKVKQGLVYFRQAIALKPDYVDAHTNLAMGMLSLGEYEQGFIEYEWRRDGKSFHKRNFAQPLWDGQPFPGKTLLIRTEQGLGDTIQFIRYVPLVKQLGDRVVVECNHQVLQPLLETIGAIDQVLVKGEPLPKFDLHISLLSLPRLLKTNLDNIPDRVPYLQIDQPFTLDHAVLVDRDQDSGVNSASVDHALNQTEGKTAKLKVGLVWRSDSKNKTRQKRSCPLTIFQQILQIPQVQFYSLQKEIQPEDLDLLDTFANGSATSVTSIIDNRAENPVNDRSDSASSVTLLSEKLNSLNDTAAAIKQLDLVISIDTMVAHLAGALAKPIWVLLPLASDWRWLLDRHDSPWYPTARLFRQTQLDHWQGVIEQVVQALTAVVSDRSLLTSPQASQGSTSANLSPEASESLQAATIPAQQVQKVDQVKQPASITNPSQTVYEQKTPAIAASLTMQPSITIPRQTATQQKQQAVINSATPTTSTTPAKQSKQAIGISWAIGSNTGWGMLGYNLTMQLLMHETFTPFLIAQPAIELTQASPLEQVLLAPTLAQRQKLQQTLNNNPNSGFNLNIPIIHGLGNRFGGSQIHRFKGSHNIGYIFFEDTYLDADALKRARAFDLILTGSNWSSEILQNYGLDNVHTVWQGIDPTAYYPSPKSGLFSDRFVIFSGGKLEYRKAQDIVIAAYKIFQARHPDALLITAWHNPLPQFMQGLDRTGNVTALPTIDANGKLQIEPWLIQNGLPIGSFIDLGAIPPHQMPQIMREADVAVFPNRSEAGANLVAMECLACGVPCIISANTGHLDIIDEKHCYPLSTQRSLPDPPQSLKGAEGWGESDVEEVVARLEQVYSDRQTALNKGAAAVEFMQNLTWEKRVDRLVEVIQTELLN
jgi:tetratricopeptide (TPR) repeat protein/glycosyltransferase involved in cell wall biosynthesis